MFKSLVSGRGVLCNSEGDTPSPQILYGGVPQIVFPPSTGILSGACSALGKHPGGGSVSWGGLGEGSPGMLGVSYLLPSLSSSA